jgi:hypothetical protein
MASGAVGGVAGNLAGLHIGALGGVRNKGMGVADALARGDTIGSRIGTEIGTVDMLTNTLIQSLWPTDQECECSR